MSFRLVTIVMFLVVNFQAKAQQFIGTRVYSELKPYTWMFYGEPNELGFQFVARNQVYIGDSPILPGLLVQLDHKGNLLYTDTLRASAYHFAFRIDSILFFGSDHYEKISEGLYTFVFEVCDLRGNVIQSFEQDFYQNLPRYSGVAQVNDSIYIFTQSCMFWDGGPSGVFYIYNSVSQDIRIKLVEKGGVLGRPIRVDDKPTFLEWTFDLYVKDTNFVHTTTLNTDTTRASNWGTMLPREDKPGWFGFGGCRTPSNKEGLCMMAFDDQLNLDKVDLIYHLPEDNRSYFAATNKSICRSGDDYYVGGVWNAISISILWFNDSFPVDIVIAKYDKQLNRVWTKIVGGDRRYRPFNVQPTIDGGFLVAGGVRDNLNDHQVYPFAMFFDADGELVGTEEEIPPGRYEFTIYGNPGREALRIMSRFDGGQAQLLVVDMMGRPVLQRNLTEGLNEYETAYWPAGTYLMTITDQQGRILWNQPWIKVD
jgi:hypothetical protein